MYNIEVLGENGAWYKVSNNPINVLSYFPHKFHSIYTVFEAHFFTEKFFFFSRLHTFFYDFFIFIALYCDFIIFVIITLNL